LIQQYIQRDLFPILDHLKILKLYGQSVHVSTSIISDDILSFLSKTPNLENLMIPYATFYANKLECISDLCPNLFKFHGNISLRNARIAPFTKIEVFKSCKCILMEKWRNMDEFFLKIFSYETPSVAIISMHNSLNVPLHYM